MRFFLGFGRVVQKSLVSSALTVRAHLKYTLTPEPLKPERALSTSGCHKTLERRNREPLKP